MLKQKEAQEEEDMKMERTINVRRFFGISLVGCLCIGLGYMLSWHGLNWLVRGLYSNLSTNASDICDTLVTVGFSLIFYMFVRTMMKGRLRNGFNLKNVGKGLLIPLPYVFIMGVCVAGSLLIAGDIGNPVKAMVIALAAGIAEELVYRDLLISFVMRKGATTKNVVIAFILSGLIFSCLHFTNLLFGAGMGNTITQVCNTFGFGCILAVTFLRSGSILPCIIAHFVLDTMCLLTPELSKSGGLLVGDDKFQWSALVLPAVCFVYAVIMLTVNMKKIKEVWAK